MDTNALFDLADELKAAKDEKKELDKKSKEVNAMIAALKENGYGDIVTEMVNANTLASFCKEQMAANEDEPPEWLSSVVNTFEKVTVGIRKS